MPLPLVLPVAQNWSCHSCGDCCRYYQVRLTPAEKQHVLDQNWTQAHGVPAGEELFERIGMLGKKETCLRRNPADGACVFLDDQNRCRMHARLGEASKLAACRAYPYTFHPIGDRIAVAVRFSCPSVAQNRGTPLTDQVQALTELRDLLVPDTAEARNAPPPIISGNQQLDWLDTCRIANRLRDFLCADPAGNTFATRLVHALFVVQMLGQANLQKIRGQRIDELLDALFLAAPMETVPDARELPEPTALGRTQFRLIVAQYANENSPRHMTFGQRLRNAADGLRLTLGTGMTPHMRAILPSVPFSELERPFSGATPEIEQTFHRYFSVKLSSLCFCGSSCYELTLVEGFAYLATNYAITMFLARWIARGQDRSVLSAHDVQHALRLIDYRHGRSPAMGAINFRRRIQSLVKTSQLPALVGWYGR